MPSSWPVSNGGYLAQLSIEYCYVATISGFSRLEAVGPPAPHNTQKVGKTKLRIVGREVIDTRTGGGDRRIATTPNRRADRLLHCRCQQAGLPHVATLVLRHIHRSVSRGESPSYCFVSTRRVASSRGSAL